MNINPDLNYEASPKPHHFQKAEYQSPENSDTDPVPTAGRPCTTTSSSNAHFKENMNKTPFHPTNLCFTANTYKTNKNPYPSTNLTLQVGQSTT